MGRNIGEEKKNEKRKLDLLEIIHSLNSTLQVTWEIWVGGGAFTGSVTEVHAVFKSV